MRTISKTSVAAILLLTSQKQISAQILAVETFGLVPQCNYSHCSSGFGMNLLFNPLDPDFHEDDAIEVHFGFGGYYCGLQKHTVDNVPLALPQVGNSTVQLKNSVGAWNGIVRISTPYSRTIIPYIDLMAGRRYFATDMTVIPQSNNYKTTSQNLLRTDQFSYGTTIGVMASLGDNVKIDLGIMYSNSPDAGKTLDVNNSYTDSDGLSVNKTDAIKALFLFKAGITFQITDWDWLSSSSSSESSSSSSGCFLFGDGCGGSGSGGSSSSNSSSTSSSSGSSTSGSTGSSTSGSGGGGRTDNGGGAKVNVHIK